MGANSFLYEMNPIYVEGSNENESYFPWMYLA